MKKHLLFIASPEQLDLTRSSLCRLDGQDFQTPLAQNTFSIKHKNLGEVELELHLISELDAITPHLRQNPVDLMIYDERGGTEATQAMVKIHEDVRALAKLWGPDFLFPMRRTVAIIEGTPDAANRSFILGRDHIRDVLVAPRNLGTVLRWVAKLLTKDQEVSSNKVGIALSGGGLEGFLYQLGAIHALETAIDGRTFRSFDVYSGVSSGSIIASLLAGKVPIEEVVKAIYGKSNILPELKSTMIFDLDTAAILKRIGTQSIKWAGIDPSKWIRKTLRSIPTGLFKGEKLRDYFEETICAFGCNDSFEDLDAELFIGATDQDTFEHVVLGRGDWADIPISQAIRASCALPPFFTPIKLNRRWFIDGQVTRTCNLELTVKRGCRLIFIVDPLKPYALSEPGSVDKEGGVYALIQTVKALVYTRFRTTLQHLTERYADVDFLVFQPDEECAQKMAGSPMRYRIRNEIIDLAFRGTLRKLRERHHVYSVKLERFDMKLKPKKELLEIERIGIEF